MFVFKSMSENPCKFSMNTYCLLNSYHIYEGVTCTFVLIWGEFTVPKLSLSLLPSESAFRVCLWLDMATFGIHFWLWHP